MRKALMAAIAGGLVLTGCGQQASPVEDVANVELSAPAPPEAPATPDAAASAQNVSRPETPAAAVAPSIAYAYRFGLELPTEAAPKLMSRHEQACLSAGPVECQVLGAQSNRVGRDSLTARLEMRASPAYVARFRAQLESEAQGAGGRVIEQSVESEDLTRQLIDTEARVNAMTTLRDRLQQLLATRSGSLEQLFQVEGELARVQGELDATRSTLEMMRTRVRMSRLDITYQAAGQLAPDSALRPVSNALNSAVHAFMSSLGVVILIVAGVAPPLLLAIPLALIIRRWRKRESARKAAQAKTTEGSPPA